ncbi:hypothetical protein COCOBI_01-0560 [Coccomyxa sp. Obi]|nr:hypothetical protein COCOBI_01-0560 [Coccomyxa sp. Obi]
MTTSWLLLLLCTFLVVINATDIDDLATGALKGAAHEAEDFASYLHKVILKKSKTVVTTAIPTSSNLFSSTQLPHSSTPLPPNSTAAPTISTLLALSTTPGLFTMAPYMPTSTIIPLSSTQLPPTSTNVPIASSTSPIPPCQPGFYDFSNFTFTHANATGRFGPTLAALQNDVAVAVLALFSLVMAPYCLLPAEEVELSKPRLVETLKPKLQVVLLGTLVAQGYSQIGGGGGGASVGNTASSYIGGAAADGQEGGFGGVEVVEAKVVTVPVEPELTLEVVAVAGVIMVVVAEMLLILTQCE